MNEHRRMRIGVVVGVVGSLNHPENPKNRVFERIKRFLGLSGKNTTKKRTIFFQKRPVSSEKRTVFFQKRPVSREKRTVFFPKRTVSREKRTVFFPKRTVFYEKRTVFL